MIRDSFSKQIRSAILHVAKIHTKCVHKSSNII